MGVPAATSLHDRSLRGCKRLEHAGTGNIRRRFESCPERATVAKRPANLRPLSNRESESFGAFGTGTVANSGISERHPETAGRTRESTGGVQAIAGDGRNPLNPAGLATRMKKRRALSRSAFHVNQWVAIVRSRLKGSPEGTLFETMRADFRAFRSTQPVDGE